MGGAVVRPIAVGAIGAVTDGDDAPAAVPS